MTTRSDCGDLLNALRSRTLTHWSGFTISCPLSILFDQPPADLDSHAFWYLGAEHVETRFVPVALAGYDKARVSFQKGIPVLFDAAYPELTGAVSELKASLGEPSAKLDWYHTTLEMEGGEWVYPARGITLFLNSDLQNLLHIALYASGTSLSDYENRLRPDLQVRRRPTRE